MRRKILWILLILIVILGICIVIFDKESGNKLTQKFNKYPACPASVEGILNYQLIDIDKIASMTPLGNLNPPGHTSPVDHIYFSTDSNAKIAVYAPADAWVTNIISVAIDAGQGFEPRGYVIQLTICDGLVLDFANNTDISQPLKDNILNQKGDCKDGPKKEGHDGPERQCSYSLNYKVSSGEQIGYVQPTVLSDGGFDLQFEIWAANYNKPAPGNIDWSYYDDDRYAHIMCPFDLYSGELKNKFYAKLGGIDRKIYKDEKTGKKIETGSSFKPRTIEPICGTVNQNIVGTIQGMWFGEGWKLRKDKNNPDDTRQFSFLHWNIDPTYAEIGNAGEISNGQADQITFLPKHTGTVDREPSEVTADGKVYCYNFRDGKILTELIDDRHLKLEYQLGFCGDVEIFSKPYNYER